MFEPTTAGDIHNLHDETEIESSESDWSEFDGDQYADPLGEGYMTGSDSEGEDEEHVAEEADNDSKSSDDDDGDVEPDDSDGTDEGGGLKRGTARWYRQKRYHFITEGSTVTVLKAAYWVALMKSQLRVTDIVIDTVCAMIHYLLLPAGNMFPPSYHLVRSVLGVPHSSTVTRHVCDKCWSLFPDLDPLEWAAHANEVCETPGCNNDRFEVPTSGPPKAKRNVYYFGDRASIVDLICKPGVYDAITSNREKSFDEEGTFWASPAGKALDEACGFKFSAPAADEFAVLVTLGATSLS